MSVKFIDHSEQVKAQMAANKKAALAAMGLKAVELTINQMQSGYSRRIWQTGDLQRDVNHQVENSAPDTVDVGNSLFYAPFVHEGTRFMDARHYIRDAIMGGATAINKIAQSYLKKGF